MKKIASSIRLAGLLTLALGGQAAMAAPLPVYAPTYPSPNSACATNGNFVSCSTRVLDYLASKNYAGFTGPYAFAVSYTHLRAHET